MKPMVNEAERLSGHNACWFLISSHTCDDGHMACAARLTSGSCKQEGTTIILLPWDMKPVSCCHLCSRKLPIGHGIKRGLPFLGSPYFTKRTTHIGCMGHMHLVPNCAGTLGAMPVLSCRVYKSRCASGLTSNPLLTHFEQHVRTQSHARLASLLSLILPRQHVLDVICEHTFLTAESSPAKLRRVFASHETCSNMQTLNQCRPDWGWGQGSWRHRCFV